MGLNDINDDEWWLWIMINFQHSKYGEYFDNKKFLNKI